MTVLGRVRNGVVVPDQPLNVPEGAEVHIEVPAATVPVGGTAVPSGREGSKKTPSLYDRLKPFVGCIKDLPPDFSVNYDHYLYGAEKRE